MHWHLILTEKCNLQCRYCYGKSNSLEEFDNELDKKFKFDFSDPCVSQVRVEELKKFLEKDESPVLVFYGGEPLLQIEKIKEIMDSLEDIKVKFRMQTNGVFLDKIPMEYLNKIDKILVSVDGNMERTDKNRGEGIFEKVYKNVQKIKSAGYSGELIARMTIAQDCPDLYDQVLNLIELGFESIHWQLDVGFYKTDFQKDKILSFIEEYNKSLNKLNDWWLEEIRNGKVWKLYPFVGIIKPLLEGRANCGLRCGAGNFGYAISTSGKVVACPIMNNIENFKAGSLSSDIKELKKFDCLGECKNCGVYGLCGGRCMYWRKSRMWPTEGDEVICNSIRCYINKLKGIFPEIKKLIKNGIVNEKGFDYEDYFGPEIIP